MAEYISDTRGVSALIIAFLAIPIFGAIGLSVDLGRAYVLKSKLSTALDAAGLAAGRVIFDDDAKILADAQMFFEANFPDGYMGADVSALDITWDANKENIELKVDATFDTSFMSIVGNKDLTVGTRTVINRVNRGLELIMVLDNTGSMARDSDSNNYGGAVENQRIGVLRTAAKDLVEILYGDNETQNNLWVGIVPYVTQVNIGPRNIGFLETDDQLNIIDSVNTEFKKENGEFDEALLLDVDLDGSFDTSYGWKGCVEMRGNLAGGTVDTMDDPPNEDFNPFVYFNGHPTNPSHENDNDWNDSNPGDVVHIATQDVTQWNSFNNSIGRGPNSGCPSQILPLTAEKTTVMASLDAMRPWYSGGTMGNVGMVWGWRAISPRWRGHWKDSDNTLPLDYDEPLVDKVVIMMTDGENTIFSHGSQSIFDYNSYSRHEKSPYWRNGPADYNASSTDSYTNRDGRLRYTSTSYYRNYVDDKFAAICENMKTAGVTIYTIKFKAGNESLYRNCATSDAHFYNSPTTEALEDAFKSIGQELSNLRVAE